MIKNYLKTALRSLLRYKSFSIINILSLTIGITGCLLVGLFVNDEWAYDKSIPGGETVYRFYEKRSDKNTTAFAACVPPTFATYIQQHYPEVLTTTRILMFNAKTLVQVEETKSYEEPPLMVDSTFFRVFPLKFLQGDPNTALNTPGSVVLTKELAKKYFGTANPIGKTIQLNNAHNIVRGVLDEVPEHFHLPVNYLIPLFSVGIPEQRMKSWMWQQFYTYVKVKPGTNVEALQAKFQEAVKKETEEQAKKSGFAIVPFLQPLKDIHLKSADFIFDNAKRGNQAYVKGLSLIAIFVLLIGCFNFINLATARSTKRATEIGVRKVMGAWKGQLVLQFTAETILLSFMAVVLATIATVVILPMLNHFTGKSISFHPITDIPTALILLGLALAIGILAGIYPAWVLSGFQPIRVLKGLKTGVGRGGAAFFIRQGLVTIQFALSVLLIVCTMIVYRQLNYLHEKDLGFSKEQVVYFPAQGDIPKHAEQFKQELLRSPDIISATAGYGLPGDILAGDRVRVINKDGEKEEPTDLFIVDFDYIKTLGLQMVAGREFSKKYATDAEEAFIINETAAKEFGFGNPQNAIGQKIAWDKWLPDSLMPVKRGEVIGVVKDFHYKSLHEKVSKAVLVIYPQYVLKVAVKINSAHIDKTLAFIKNTYSKFSPEYPLNYNFLDDNFAKMYASEEKLGGLLWVFTIMSIVVGCLGLFGLAAFSTEQRIKEIGIRKVLGASVGSILTLLSSNFVKLILIALVLASPVAWWAMNKWLEDFAYRVTISGWIFAEAGIAALVIALITVSSQAIRAARANPVKSLRIE